jgi:drug/metabolite transporter (DMT)-like permease
LLIRYAIVAGLLGGWLLMHGDFQFANRAAIARASVIGVLAHAVWLSAALGGIALGVSPWIVALITALQPMLTSVLSGPVLGEKILPVQWWGTCIGLVGVVVVVITKLEGSAGVSPWGYLLPFVAAASMTVSTLYQRHLNGNHAVRLRIINSLFVQATTSVIFLVPLAVVIEGLQVQWTGQFIFALAWLVIMLSIGSYGLMLKLLERRTVARVASLMYLTPPTTLVLGSLLFGDSIKWVDGLGLVITAIGVSLVYQSTINLKRRNPRADPRRYLSMKP